MAACGIIVIRKEAGISSQGVVSRVKRLLSADKCGHTGTLDPLAEGVLPVLVGRAVKASDFMLSADKHYRAGLLLGKTTDTEDITGQVLTECDEIPSDEQVAAAIASFVGEGYQTPPMYSAIKKNGKRLYELAREGIEIERESRPITVYSIEARKTEERLWELDVHCSKGTYIRTLCADIGARLGVGGVMSSLVRTRAAGFDISAAITLGELEELSLEQRLSRLIPVENIFLDKREVTLSPFFERLARAGAEIYLKKIGTRGERGELVRLSGADGFFALGEVREFDEGLAIKPIRQF